MTIKVVVVYSYNYNNVVTLLEFQNNLGKGPHWKKAINFALMGYPRQRVYISYAFYIYIYLSN